MSEVRIFACARASLHWHSHFADKKKIPRFLAWLVAAASPDLASTILACYLSFKVSLVLNEQQTTLLEVSTFHSLSHPNNNGCQEQIFSHSANLQ
jgi:hypothetical protein